MKHDLFQRDYQSNEEECDKRSKVMQLARRHAKLLMQAHSMARISKTEPVRLASLIS
jgi:hypothetical protein